MRRLDPSRSVRFHDRDSKMVKVLLIQTRFRTVIKLVKTRSLIKSVIGDNNGNVREVDNKDILFS